MLFGRPCHGRLTLKTAAPAGSLKCVLGAGVQGGLLLAMQAGMSVVPVAIVGARRILGRAAGLRPLVPGHCTIVVGRPVCPAAGMPSLHLQARLRC